MHRPPTPVHSRQGDVQRDVSESQQSYVLDVGTIGRMQVRHIIIHLTEMPLLVFYFT